MKKPGRLLPEIMGTPRSGSPTGIELLGIGAPQPRARRSDDTIVPASSLSTMPLAWAVGPVTAQSQYAAILGKSAAKKPRRAVPAPEIVFCLKGTATAQGFRPAYWFYEREPEEPSPSARARSAKTKPRRGSS